MTLQVEAEREFDCVECDRHIVRYCFRTGEPELCAECMFMPGWFNDSELVRLFDPDRGRTFWGIVARRVVRWFRARLYPASPLP